MTRRNLNFVPLLIALIFAEAIYPFILLANPGNAAAPPATEELAKRRRRTGKSGLFPELEIFRHNLDIFLGPALHIGNGTFFDEIEAGISKSSTTFKPGAITINKIFFSGTGGVQYRNTPWNEKDGLAGMLSFSAGLGFQQRGYEYKYEYSSIKQSDTITDFFNINESCRANYLTIPISARIGRRIFLDAGITMDFMIFGTTEVILERSAGYTGDPRKNPGYSSFFGGYTRSYRIQKAVPLMSLGYAVFGGINFSENIGIRLGANMNNAFFKENSNPSNSNFGSVIFSVQLIGGINTNKF
jgi:hypothetical protein